MAYEVNLICFCAAQKNESSCAELGACPECDFARAHFFSMAEELRQFAPGAVRCGGTVTPVHQKMLGGAPDRDQGVTLRAPLTSRYRFRLCETDIAF